MYSLAQKKFFICTARVLRSAHNFRVIATDGSTSSRDFLATLNSKYSKLHTAKEDAFWQSYMGLREDIDAARREFTENEIALQRFLQDPALLTETRKHLSNIPQDSTDAVALKGWERMFSTHVIDNDEARHLSETIIDMEGKLAQSRSTMNLTYDDPDHGTTVASSVKLGALMGNDTRAEVRQSAWKGLRSIEQHVLSHGFLDIVRARNRLGRMLGGEDYYDFKVKRTEGMSKGEVFTLLDELEASTRHAARESIQALGKVEPWDFRYLTAGDVSVKQDPYFSFERSVATWGEVFQKLGVRYDGATLVLDLLDRKGKYENGFMHAPEVSWSDPDSGTRHRARIHFTANALPGVKGAGRRALQTLFHEGGHAAHFANINMPDSVTVRSLTVFTAPCFGQEFAPTSVWFAETQSMFLDSLIDDADFIQRYARNAAGDTMPQELLEEGLGIQQRYAAWAARAMLVVCYAEKAIYEIPDNELTAESVLAAIRKVEQDLLFLSGSPRPVLSVPHLLSGESSAYYHGYVLAEMAVHQTRDFFLHRDGHLVDNKRIGADMCEHYWRHGNSRPASDMVKGLTGKGLAAASMAAHVTRSVSDTLQDAREQMTRTDQLAPYRPVDLAEVDLDAAISIVHGNETIASLPVQSGTGGFKQLAEQFGSRVREMAAEAR